MKTHILTDGKVQLSISTCQVPMVQKWIDARYDLIAAGNAERAAFINHTSVPMINKFFVPITNKARAEHMALVKKLFKAGIFDATISIDGDWKLI